jgi:hypothetical protein
MSQSLKELGIYYSVEFLKPHERWDVEKVKGDITGKLEPILKHVGQLDTGGLQLSEIDVTFDIQGDIIVVKADGSLTLKFTRSTTEK